MAQRKAREDSFEGKWSIWEPAMIPMRPDLLVGFEPRGPNQAGLICSSIRNAFPLQAQHCGIYEWRAKGTLPHQPSHIVYLGSTCRTKPGALRRRILEYCTNGSHKGDLINDALSSGYELWVRVKIVEGIDPRIKAEAMENALLATYDYAWNIRNNGPIRHILP